MSRLPRCDWRATNPVTYSVKLSWLLGLRYPRLIRGLCPTPWWPLPAGGNITRPASPVCRASYVLCGWRWVNSQTPIFQVAFRRHTPVLSVSLDVTPTTLRHVSLLWFSPLATRYSHSSCHRPHWFLYFSLEAPTAAVPHPTHAWLPRVGWREVEDDHVTRGGAAGPHDADTWRGGKCRQRVASRGSPAGRSFVKTKPASHVAASHSRF